MGWSLLFMLISFNSVNCLISERRMSGELPDFNGWSGFLFNTTQTLGGMELKINITYISEKHCHKPMLMLFITRIPLKVRNMTCLQLERHSLVKTPDDVLGTMAFPFSCHRKDNVCSCKTQLFYPKGNSPVNIYTAFERCNYKGPSENFKYSIKQSLMTFKCGRPIPACRKYVPIGQVDDESIKHGIYFIDKVVVKGIEEFIRDYGPRNCYMYAAEMLCNLKFPKCQNMEQKEIFICKETCEDAMELCAPFFANFSDFHGLENICHLFRSKDETSSDCLYKPPKCEALKPIPHSTFRNRVTGRYILSDYICNQGYQLNGNGTVRCLPDSSWTPVTALCIKDGSLVLPTWVQAFIIVLCIMLLLISVIYVVYQRKKNHGF